MRTPPRTAYPVSAGSFARIRSGPDRLRFEAADQVAEPAQRGAQWDAALLDAQQIEALGAHEGASDQRADLLGVERAERAELSLGLARQLDQEIAPAHQAGADDLGDRLVHPACGDQLLQHADVARGDVVVEIVAGAVPLLRELERRVAEQCVLAV